MKVLIIAGGFYPAKKYGGPVVSIDNMCSLFKDDMELFVIAKNHDLGEHKILQGISDGWNLRGNCKVYYLDKDEYNTEAFYKIYKYVLPDFIYINSLFSAKLTLPFLKLCKKEKCHALLAPRGQLCTGAFKKKYKKIPYIVYLKLFGLLKEVYFQSTSDEESRAISKYLSVNKGKIFLLSNIPSIPMQGFSMNKKKCSSGNFVFLARIHPKKNLIGAISYLSNIKGNVNFDIYGPVEDKKYWNECKSRIKELNSNVRVNYCGLVSHDKVHETFSKYDAFLFPTFSENFGHVIAESLIVGTPVIISNQTPWNDVKDAHAGFVCSLENENEFVDSIQKIIDLPYDEYIKFRIDTKKYAISKLDIDKLKKQYESCFKKVIGDKS